MSFNPNDFNFLQMELDRNAVTAVPGVPALDIAHQLESLVNATRVTESNLARERAYSQKLRDYAQNASARIHQLQVSANAVGEELRQLRLRETELGRSNAQMTQELQKARSQLSQFQGMWNSVVQREREAVSVIAEADQRKKYSEELESQLRALTEALQKEKQAHERAEEHRLHYQKELQALLLRVHSSEAKYSELAKELEAYRELKKNYQFELAKSQTEWQQRFENELCKERENLKLTMEREIAVYREQVREMERAKLILDWDQQLPHERRKLEEGIRKELDQFYQAEFARQSAQLKAEFSNALALEKKNTARLQAESEAAAAANETLKVELQQCTQAVSDLESLRRSADDDAARASLEQGAALEALQQERKRYARLSESFQALQLAVINEDSRFKALLRDLETQIEGADSELIFDRKALDYLKSFVTA